jgi:hypothetical protein
MEVKIRLTERTSKIVFNFFSASPLYIFVFKSYYMEEKKVKLRIEVQQIGDSYKTEYNIDYLIISILINNNSFSVDRVFRVNMPSGFNESKSTFVHYPFVHN